MIDFRCQECGATFGAPEAMAGQSLTCPKCGGMATASLPTAVPVPIAPQANTPYAPAARQSTGMAVAALILGICGLVPVLGAVPALLGIILGILVLAGRRGGRGLAIGGMVTGAVSLLLVQVALMVAILLPTLGSARGLARRAVCQSNLYNVAMAVQVYMNSNDDLAPADLQSVVDGGFLPGQLLECPSEGTRGNVDYFYFRLPADAPGNSLMVCDLKGNHGGEGRNVLLLDATVKWLSEAEFRDELAQPQNADFAKALAEVEGPAVG